MTDLSRLLEDVYRATPPDPSTPWSDASGREPVEADDQLEIAPEPVLLDGDDIADESFDAADQPQILLDEAVDLTADVAPATDPVQGVHAHLELWCVQDDDILPRRRRLALRRR
jgi:hypothetical protein